MGFNANDWNESDSGGFDEPPPFGTYEVEVTHAGAFESKDGRAFAKLTFRVLAGTELGHEWDQIGSLEGGGLFYTKGRLHALGYPTERPVDSLQELDYKLGQVIEGVQAVVKVEPGTGGYTNTEILRRLGAADVPHPEGVPPDVPGAKADEFVHPQQASLEESFTPSPPVAKPRPEPQTVPAGPPQKGDIDPETGEPIPF
jgi:hypothetical protein